MNCLIRYLASSKGRASMQIFIVLKSYNTYDRLNDRRLFEQLLKKCKELGINTMWSDHHLKTGGEKFVIVDIPGKTENNKIPPSEISLFTDDKLMVGYMFISHNPKKRHLTLKRFMDHFDELVIDQDQSLLDELYSLEYEIYGLLLH
jgi:hypothetical protein